MENEDGFIAMRQEQVIVRWLDEAIPVEEVGGKAAHLAELLRKGLPAVPGFVVTTHALDLFLEACGLPLPSLLSERGDPDSLAERSEAIQARMCATPLPEEIVTTVEAAIERAGFEETPVAVRSSGILEDAAATSFAGQYDTLLDVTGKEAILRAIQHCWRSLFSVRALTYHANLDETRREEGFSPSPFRMAVLVQRMIPATVSGILFTANPKTGDPSEMLIDAVAGLGDRLVSGSVQPVSYRIRRGRFGRLHPLPAGANGTGSEGEGGGLLQKEDLEALGRLGLRIEGIFKVPQDIEWCLHEGRLHLLQARPITSLLPPPASKERPVIWTRRFSGERWTQPVSPLGWSVMQRILHHFTHFPRTSERFLEGAMPTRIVAGHIYFNITILVRLLVKFPGSFLPAFLLELLPDSERKRIEARRFLFPPIPFLWSMFVDACREGMWGRFDWNIFANDRHWEAFIPEFEARLSAIERAFEEAPDARSCLGHLEATHALALDYIRIHLMSLAYSNLFYQGLGFLLRRWVGDRKDDLRAFLVSGLPGNMTVEMNKELWRLSRMAAASAPLRELFGTTSAERIYALLPSVSPEFLEALDRFLEKFGHRSHASWEIFSPRWREDPSFVLAILQEYLNLEGGEARLPSPPVAQMKATAPIDPIAREREMCAQREDVTRSIEAEIARHPMERLFPLRTWIFRKVLGYAQRYMATRENQRFYFDKLVFLKKHLLQAILEELAARKLLEDSRAGSFLTLEEVADLLEGRLSPGEAAQRIATRRTEYERNRRHEAPVFLLDDLPLHEPPEGAKATLTGLGVSPGRFTGRVKILFDPSQARCLTTGEILVTRATDPGWTPIFLKIGGIVMELGSLLSHGAVVAREYRLPAVVNVPGATTRLRDGQLITIDGSSGSIFLHS
ncbi:MAG: hypothetical protein D6812_13040 [Deltaproteobacteria bacterium]|nr:MAG: hypothetical protein D6812_13040 [Deltaproteobacteria bacterium]